MKKITQNNLENILNFSDIENIHFFRVDFSFFDFSDKNLFNCKFEKCNLSNVRFKDTSFNNVSFIKSKIMGVKFSEISDYAIYYDFEKSEDYFQMIFEECNISMCNFYQMEIKNISFKNSEIIDSNFTRANLENSDFSNCNLEKTIFSESNLSGTNFKYASNFSIDPTINFLMKTKFSSDNAFLLLANLDIEID